MDNQFEKYNDIPKEEFALVGSDRVLHDQRFETKPIGYFKDAFMRFARNKASVVAAIIIGILLVYAIVGPFCCNKNYTKAYTTDTSVINYQKLRPRLPFLSGTGVWDGTKVEKKVSQKKYDEYRGMEQERGLTIITDVISSETVTDDFGKVSTYYTIRIDTYTSLRTMTATLTSAEYKALQKWQDENNVQVILPRVKYNEGVVATQMPNIWYKIDRKMNAQKDEDGNLIPSYYVEGADDYTSKMRLASDPYNDGDVEGAYRYAQRTGKEGQFNYVVRVDSYKYFQYKYGFEPSFVFGTDEKGYDIFSRLASGARFSFVLAIIVSVINLAIGAFYGAAMGYYGGSVDIILDRIAEILSGVPFMVVTVLFNLHLASKVGTIPALFFAFILTGWIGMAYRVRMQFYRFKNQEYVLAARTLGAKDFRIMFKHIFPNSLGTIITGSVLVIPGVIFSETSLSYLGIINLDSATMSSVGSMLSTGQSCMTTDPHVVFFPALFIALLMISFNLFGNGLRDAFNPSLRGVEE